MKNYIDERVVVRKESLKKPNMVFKTKFGLNEGGGKERSREDEKVDR